MRYEAVDLFCGAGGTSTGILKAIRERMGRKVRLTAVNHWKTAVNTHSLNHPDVRHLCETVENLHPLDLVPTRYLHLLAASCECRFHSNARGGGVCNEQSRSQPWQLIRWATDIEVENILMENVWEFVNWGPLLQKRTKINGRWYKAGRPDPRRKGEHFRAFVNALVNLGYHVEFRRQVAMDFGDPTSRPRFILMARKSKKVVWPEPTHGPGRAHPHKSSRDHVIDWSLVGTSLFDENGVPRLCENTCKRIEGGIRKFWGEAAEDFIVLLNGSTKSHIEGSARSLDEALPTIVAGGNHILLCQPFITAYHNGKDLESRNYSIDRPLPTQDTSNRFALVEPILVTTDQVGGNGLCVRPVSRPVPTVVTKQNQLLVQPLIMKYYKTGRCKPVSHPLDTVTTKPRFLLVEPTMDAPGIGLDILVRLLQPHELARAHSFPEGYQFTGAKDDQVKQIGNSVPVELAAAHAHAILS